ncbi:TolC family protein [Taibaiella koreensis]|uniref:TolC family protein n=1 Tax=Taibaiella koreensis TaxID=1268548 RepID=UPI000E59D325|nr:efflux transporter outer membrane subunit [Taibaiella koreensis]
MKSYISKYLLVVTAMATLSACKVSKDVATPDTGLPDSYRGVTVTGAPHTDTQTIADLPWKSFFADPSLQKLIGQAIEKNFDMQLALKNIEASQLLYKQVNWNYAPDIRLQVGAASNRPSDNSLNGISANQFLKTNHIEDYNASIGLSWEADIWGKIRNQKRSALAAYLQTEEARKAIQTNIVANVARGYYNLLMMDAQLEVARKNLVLNDSTLRMIQLQFDAGQVTSLAVQQATGQRLVAAQLVPLLEQNITVQENALSVLSGVLPTVAERQSTLNSTPVAKSLATGFPSAMLGHRPDVRSSELDLTVANAKVGISKANMYPTLSITASGGVNSFKASNWFNIPASLFGTVAGNLVQPLLNKRQLKTQFEVAKIEREQSVIRFRQTVLFAVGEVSDALARLEKLQSQYDFAVQRVDALQQATGNAGMLFQSGMASYLEVITAQSNVLQSELEVATLKRDQLIAAVDLYRSLGGGWK